MGKFFIITILYCCFHGKKYQEILRKMEKEKEVLLLEKEV